MARRKTGPNDALEGASPADRAAENELADLRRESARRRAKQRRVVAAPSRPEPATLQVGDGGRRVIDEELIDPDAAKVVRRLVRAGHEAYLVGGCVRDLLLGAEPKDFDVATSARPEEVRELFRNSRIIGRRFRLVHVLYSGGKVIETATFRCNPEPGDDGDDLLIRDDNAFGEAHEDARRRDFRINGLFYDLEEQRVLDWVGGLEDVDARSLDTIGDPVVRFQEDPVRILRAIKFSARLDLGIKPSVYDAMVQCRGSLAMAARPRLFEEILRLMRGGAAHRSVWLAWETGTLDVLLPELAAFLADCKDAEASLAWRLLAEVDRRKREHGTPDDCVLFAALMLGPMREACAGSRDRMDALYDFLEPVAERLAVPRRIADATRRMVAMLPKLESGRPGRFSRTSLYSLVAQLHELDVAAREGLGLKPPEPPQESEFKKRRRRRRRKDDEADGGEADERGTSATTSDATASNADG